jgi:hypothetical protein
MKNQKNNNFLFKTKRQWAKYRWEFMRRDPDFIPRFDNLLNLNNLEVDPVFLDTVLGDNQ